MPTKESPRAATQTTVHLMLQGKGGVGKSLVASLLAQYLLARDQPVRCIDTDPVNQTFSQYRAFKAEHIQLLRNGGVDQRGFDRLIEMVLRETGVFVVDNGASTFIPLWNYLLEANVLEMLRDAGRRVYVHTVITGGQALADTLKGFKSLAETSSERNIIVWINKYFGKVERDGKHFGDMAAYRENEHKVYGSVALPRRNQDTFGRDVEDLVALKLTFEEAIRDSPFYLVSRQRLCMVQREVFEQLDALALVDP